MKIYEQNHFYWEYKGKPILLLGGSDEDNLFNHPDLMRDNLNKLRDCGGNYIRCTLSSRDEGNVWPYEKVDGFYDLNRFNPEFWDRLGRCLKEAHKRDIIVQIEVWATYDFLKKCWLKNPFNPALNYNYSITSTKLRTGWQDCGQRPEPCLHPFFYSPPALNDDQVLRKFQETFVRKVLDTCLKYPNVLYCLDNETRAPAEWAWYWAQFIHNEVKKREISIQLTEMWDDPNLKGEQHKASYEHPELFSFVEISQNSVQRGQTHYDRIIWIRNALKRHSVCPMSNVKVYKIFVQGESLEKPISTEEKIEITKDRFWQNIFAGCASTRFHRPEEGSGIGLGQRARSTIKAARVFISEFDIFCCEPQNELLSERVPNEAYCLASLRRNIYAVYFPKGGDVKLSIENENHHLRFQWFDPLTVSFTKSVQIKESNSIILNSPDKRQTWLALLK